MSSRRQRSNPLCGRYRQVSLEKKLRKCIRICRWQNVSIFFRPRCLNRLTGGYRRLSTWWRHQMETFSAFLAFWGGEFTSEFPAQRPETRSFGVFLEINCEAGDLRRYRAHYDVILMNLSSCSPRRPSNNVYWRQTPFWNTINWMQISDFYSNFADPRVQFSSRYRVYSNFNKYAHIYVPASLDINTQTGNLQGTPIKECPLRNVWCS